ncbi:ribose-5-phosphate isomerase [bacterium]|nr:ribose-5-phosphate isomerase [bacterium]|tara:strand:+ start:5433 stop:5930 length:498 start_codon:yes stop_codon:yes gene_type:complete
MIYIGSDHQGFKLKEKIKVYLDKLGFRYEDMGAYKLDKQDDYPDFAKEVCNKVVGNAHVRSVQNFGILICGTGIGMSIAANKLSGIRAALCCNTESAKSAREHNNANVLCLSKNADYKNISSLCSSRTLKSEQSSDYKNITKAFLDAKFTKSERHIRRLNKIHNS